MEVYTIDMITGEGTEEALKWVREKFAKSTRLPRMYIVNSQTGERWETDIVQWAFETGMIPIDEAIDMLARAFIRSRFLLDSEIGRQIENRDFPRGILYYTINDRLEALARAHGVGINYLRNLFRARIEEIGEEYANSIW